MQVNKHRGMNLPIMTLHERVLSVLGCKYVDDVLIDAPYTISQVNCGRALLCIATHRATYGIYCTAAWTNASPPLYTRI